VVPSGLVDLEAGGFRMTSRDPVSHEVHAIATGKGGEVCAALHSEAPCLPVRLDKLALERPPFGITTAQLLEKLDGRISVAQRRFRLTGAVDGLDVSVLHKSKTHAHGTLQLAADGSFAGGRPSGTLTVRDARGYIMLSPFYGGLVDARFDGHTFELTRVRVEVPGAKVAGKGGGTYDDFRVGYGVVITNALALRRVPRALRVVLGINSILPGRTIEGAVQKRPGKKIALHYRVLPIGFAQLAFLYRVVSGRFN